jgi:hypothetical protein
MKPKHFLWMTGAGLVALFLVPLVGNFLGNKAQRP